ncbi:uncharacterized protein LOC144616256 [Panthera onca]
MSSAKSRRIAQPRPAQSSLVQLLILGIVGQVGGSSVIQRLSSGAGSPCWVPPGREPVVTPLPFPRKKLWKANLIFRHSQGSDPLLPVAPVLPAKLCLVSRAWCGPRGLSPLDPTTRLSSGRNQTLPLSGVHFDAETEARTNSKVDVFVVKFRHLQQASEGNVLGRNTFFLTL